MDLIDFQEAYCEASDFKHLQGKHIRYVPGRGAERPLVMLLGEAPGATENLERRPFVGRSGRVLGELMSLARLTAEDEYEWAPPGEPLQVTAPANTYITNTVKFRPPNNRTPTSAEIISSRGWIRMEWKILGKPPVIVTVGRVPVACVGHKYQSLGSFVNKPFKLREGSPIIYPMYHPSYALRNPPVRPEVEKHWESLGDWLKRKGLL